MLMKAEALALSTDPQNSGSLSDEDNVRLRQAFSLVDAVNRRSYGYSQTASALTYSRYTTKNTMLNRLFQSSLNTRCRRKIHICDPKRNCIQRFISCRCQIQFDCKCIFSIRNFIKIVSHIIPSKECSREQCMSKYRHSNCFPNLLSNHRHFSQIAISLC